MLQTEKEKTGCEIRIINHRYFSLLVIEFVYDVGSQYFPFDFIKYKSAIRGEVVLMKNKGVSGLK